MNMGSNQYQKLALRTFNIDCVEQMNKPTAIINGDQTDRKRSLNFLPDIIYGVMGLTGEAGEVADLVKKGIYHGHGIDMVHLERELGDVCWYIAQICSVCGFDLGTVMSCNIEKLRKRYPEGFTEERSLHRAAGDV